MAVSLSEFVDIHPQSTARLFFTLTHSITQLLTLSPSTLFPSPYDAITPAPSRDPIHSLELMVAPLPTTLAY